MFQLEVPRVTRNARDTDDDTDDGDKKMIRIKGNQNSVSQLSCMHACMCAGCSS